MFIGVRQRRDEPIFLLPLALICSVSSESMLPTLFHCGDPQVPWASLCGRHMQFSVLGVNVTSRTSTPGDVVALACRFEDQSNMGMSKESVTWARRCTTDSITSIFGTGRSVGKVRYSSSSKVPIITVYMPDTTTKEAQFTCHSSYRSQNWYHLNAPHTS